MVSQGEGAPVVVAVVSVLGWQALSSRIVVIPAASTAFGVFIGWKFEIKITAVVVCYTGFVLNSNRNTIFFTVSPSNTSP